MRIAIVPVGRSAHVELVSAELLERVAKWQGCETVDRTSLANILHEKALDAGSSESYAARIQMALPADVFAFVEPGLISPKAIRLRVTEARSGAVLCDTVASADTKAVSSLPIEVALTNALQKKVTLGSSAHYVAWLGAGTEETEGRLAYEAAALSVLVGPDLLASPRLAVLDRAHLATLGDESHVSGLDQALRLSVVIAEASVRRAGASGDADISLQMRRVSGASVTSLVMRVSLTNLSAVAHTMAQNIQTVMLGPLQGAVGAPARAEDEAALLSARAQALVTSGEWARALELAEGAYALQRSQNNRLQLAGILASAEPDNPKSLGRAAEVLAEYYQVIASERSFPYWHSIPVTNVNDRSTWPVLQAWRYFPNGVYHGRSRSSVANAGDQSAWQLLQDQEEDLFRTRLHAFDALYSPLPPLSKEGYDGGGEVRCPAVYYWGTWLDRVEHFESFRPDDPPAQAALLTEAVDQFVARLATNKWICPESVETVIATVQSPVYMSVTSTPACVAAYVGYLRHLHGSKDPLLRMVCCYGVIAMQRLGFTASLGDLARPEVDLAVDLASIMADEMPLENPCRITMRGENAVFGLILGRGLPQDHQSTTSQAGLFEVRFSPFSQERKKLPVAPIIIKAQYKVLNKTFPPEGSIDSVKWHHQGIIKLPYGNPPLFRVQDYLAALVRVGCTNEAESLALGMRPGPGDLESSETYIGSFWRKFLILLVDAGRTDGATRLAQMLHPDGDSLAIVTGAMPKSVQEPISSSQSLVHTNRPVADSPWNNYVLTPLGAIQRSYNHQGYSPYMEQRAKLRLHLIPNGEFLDIVDLCMIDAGPGRNFFGEHMVRLSLDTGAISRDRVVKLERWDSSAGGELLFYVSSVAVDAHHTYLGTRDGVQVIENETGKTSWIDTRNGLPGSRIRAMAVLGPKLYLAIGGGGDEPFNLVAYDTGRHAMDIVASERSLQAKSEWDGKHINVKCMSADSKRNLLWLCDWTGIWRWDVSNGKLSLMVKLAEYATPAEDAVGQHGSLYPVLPSFRGYREQSGLHYGLYDISSDVTLAPWPPHLGSYRDGNEPDWTKTPAAVRAERKEAWRKQKEMLMERSRQYPVFNADHRVLVKLSADIFRAGKYANDVFSLGAGLELVHDYKSYPYESDEDNRPLGELVDLAVTDRGVVLVNARGRIFLLRERKPGENQLESWKVEPLLDPELARYASGILGGQTISAEQLEALHQRFRRCVFDFDWDERNGFYELADEEAAIIYANAVCMAVIDPERYGRWPAEFRWVDHVLKPLKESLKYHHDPALHAAVILPASRCDDTAFAAAEYQRLAVMNPAWAAIIMKLARKSGDYHDMKFVDAVSAPSSSGQASIADPYLLGCMNEIMAGHKLSDDQISTCEKRFSDRKNELKKQTPANQEFSGRAAAIFYVNAICMAVICPDRHGGWPTRYDGRSEAVTPLRDLAKDTEDPLLRMAVIMAQLSDPKNSNDVWNNLKQAEEAYWRLRHDHPEWANQILKFLSVGGSGPVSIFEDRVYPL
ncbi:MAG: hypothetical protein WCS52_03670 [bacterium]